jgi:exodeoxyribonuclease X
MNMKLIVLDTETSDLEPANGAAILELAWMNLEYIDNDLEWTIISAYETYVQYNGPINPKAQASHHIKADCLKPGRAITRTDAVGKLLGEIEPDTFIVAHNVEFDSKFLPEIIHNRWICTYRSAKRIWPEAPGYSNQVLRYWLGVIPNLSVAPTVRPRAPHQALYDVATTTAILLKMLENHSPEDLYQFSQPTLLKTIEFGKHKGLPFDQIPRDYLAWLRGQPRLDADLKFTLDSILQS